jgi:hypothetical protein
MAHGARTYAETRNCNHCGKPYMRRRDAVKHNRGLYCSIICSNAGRFGPLTADIAVLRKMYCEQGMTLMEMRSALKMGWQRIRRELVKAGVGIRKGERRRNPNRRSMSRYRRMANAGKGEVVHHLNCIETDDRLENLVAVSRRRHSQLHKQLGQISAKLFMAGLVSFSSRNGYEITPRLLELM